MPNFTALGLILNFLGQVKQKSRGAEQGLRHVFGIGGTGTGGAQLETGPNTHLPRISSLNSVCIRDTASLTQRVPMHLRAQRGPEDLLLAYAGSAWRIFLKCVLGLLQPTKLFRSVRGLSKIKYPAGAPWSGLGHISEAAGADFGDPEARGPLKDGAPSLMHPSRILPKSMVGKGTY